jgi:hypothetical protein
MNPHFDTKIISPHQIRQCIHDLHASGAEFGLFVLIGDCPESYQTIKRCALQEFGIITLCKFIFSFGINSPISFHRL